MKLKSVFQFIIGFFLGIFLLAGGVAGAGYLFWMTMASNPPKPVFSEENPEKSPIAQKSPSPKPSVIPKPIDEASEAKENPETPSPEPSPEEEEKLPAGAYKARVNWSGGLSLRAEPSTEATRVGGVEYNTNVIILEKSADGKWQKVRLAGGEQEGWIKAGNVEKEE